MTWSVGPTCNASYACRNHRTSSGEGLGEPVRFSMSMRWSDRSGCFFMRAMLADCDRDFKSQNLDTKITRNIVANHKKSEKKKRKFPRENLQICQICQDSARRKPITICCFTGGSKNDRVALISERTGASAISSPGSAPKGHLIVTPAA